MIASMRKPAGSCALNRSTPATEIATNVQAAMRANSIGRTRANAYPSIRIAARIARVAQSDVV